uniref:Secreted protein n=1 Tax=Xiphophorus maculatus TaxID=8083 RepID=A0A3B5QLR1_XIPMA
MKMFPIAALVVAFIRVQESDAVPAAEVRMLKPSPCVPQTPYESVQLRGRRRFCCGSNMVGSAASSEDVLLPP